MRIAVLTPRPDYSAKWRWAYDVEAEALESAGAEVVPQCWSDPFDAAAFDLVLPLVAWGYHQHFGDWIGLLGRLEAEGVRVENPVPVLRWNSDKSYLAELYRAGIPIVPTEMVPALDADSLTQARAAFGACDLVVKPLVSASAYRTFRLRDGDPVPDEVMGARMMVQPWLESIRTSGEWSLIFFGGTFSHAVSKLPSPGEFRVQPEFGGIIARCDPPAGSVEVALAALAAAPCPPLYARVDLVIGNGGTLEVIELELIEPAFFLDQAPESAPAFAAAALSAAASGQQPLADCRGEVGGRGLLQPGGVDPGDERVQR